MSFTYAAKPAHDNTFLSISAPESLSFTDPVNKANISVNVLTVAGQNSADEDGNTVDLQVLDPSGTPIPFAIFSGGTPGPFSTTKSFTITNYSGLRHGFTAALQISIKDHLDETLKMKGTVVASSPEVKGEAEINVVLGSGSGTPPSPPGPVMVAGDYGIWLRSNPPAPQAPSHLARLLSGDPAILLDYATLSISGVWGVRAGNGLEIKTVVGGSTEVNTIDSIVTPESNPGLTAQVGADSSAPSYEIFQKFTTAGGTLDSVQFKTEILFGVGAINVEAVIVFWPGSFIPPAGMAPFAVRSGVTIDSTGLLTIDQFVLV